MPRPAKHRWTYLYYIVIHIICDLLSVVGGDLSEVYAEVTSVWRPGDHAAAGQ